MDHILRLIENGDTHTLLMDDELLRKLNDLIKYELVVIKGEALVLSEKGQEAKIIGVSEAIRKAKSRNNLKKKDVQSYVIHRQRPIKNIRMLYFLGVVTIFTLLFLLSATR